MKAHKMLVYLLSFVLSGAGEIISLLVETAVAQPFVYYFPLIIP